MRTRELLLIPVVLGLFAATASAQCPAGWSLSNDPGTERFGHAMAMYRDASTGNLAGPLMLGGVPPPYSSVSSDQYTWNGTSWSAIQTTTVPAARARHRMVFDSHRNRIVLFGGVLLAGLASETMEFVPMTGPNPGDWITTATTGPTARYGHAMSYDSERRRVVLFGGNSGLLYLNDTWEYDGATGVWTQVASSGPIPRIYSAMAFDAARGRTVLYGGFDGTNVFSDTWEWNGCQWRQVSIVPQNTPGPGGANILSYDTTHQRCVLYGGDVQGAWLFHGTWWQQLTPPGQGQVIRYEPAGTFDESRNAHVMHGGYSGPGLDETWVLSNRSTPRVTQHPIPVTTTTGSTIGFQVGAIGSPPLAYQWRKDGVDIVGATNFFLTLSNVQIADIGAYDCVVSNDCGSERSNPAAPTITPSCVIDLDDGSGTGTPDGFVDTSDLLYFLSVFNIGC